MEVTLQNLNEQEKEQLWANRIHECRNSPLTVEKWCEEHEIKVTINSTHVKSQRVVRNRQLLPRLATFQKP